MSDIRLQVRRLLARKHIQHNCVGNQLHVSRVLLQSGGQGGFSLGQAAEVQLGDGLADNGQRCGGAGGGGEFLEDVEGRLVLLAALCKGKKKVWGQYSIPRSC